MVCLARRERVGEVASAGYSDSGCFVSGSGSKASLAVARAGAAGAERTELAKKGVEVRLDVGVHHPADASLMQSHALRAQRHVLVCPGRNKE